MAEILIKLVGAGLRDLRATSDDMNQDKERNRLSKNEDPNQQLSTRNCCENNKHIYDPLDMVILFRFRLNLFTVIGYFTMNILVQM